jgi:methionyl aminopeptidase
MLCACNPPSKHEIDNTQKESRMTVDSEEDLEGLKRAGYVVGLALKEMAAQVKPGVTTLQLDEIGASVMKAHGANSAPRLVYRFPGATCISINNEAAHGIPSQRQVQAGDLVNLDVSAELNGYFADAALTIAVPPVEAIQHNLVRCARVALQKAIAAARAGRPIHAIGKAIEDQAASCGFETLMDLGGHGVGRTIHEDPHNVACYYNPKDKRMLSEGMVLTIEPFLTTGARSVYTDKANGWTLKTRDGSLSAQFEHTLVITKGQPVIITALPS